MLRTINQLLIFCCLAAILAVLVASISPFDPKVGYQICEEAKAAADKNCSVYSLAPFLFIKITKALNDYGVAISALAAVAVAVFYLHTLEFHRQTVERLANVNSLWQGMGSLHRTDLECVSDTYG